MLNYDKKIRRIAKRNQKYLDEFENWLKESHLEEKTIRKHVSNADLYINDYLSYQVLVSAEKGASEVFFYLNDWFIRAYIWSSVSSLKELTTSIKKFYYFMSEKQYISSEEYQTLYKMIKENMGEFVKKMEEYYDYDEADLYIDLNDLPF